MSFFNRLLANEFTNEIVNELINLKQQGSFTSEVLNLLKTDLNVDVETIKNKVNDKLGEINKLKRELKTVSNERIDKIKISMTKRDFRSKNDLFELLKY